MDGRQLDDQLAATQAALVELQELLRKIQHERDPFAMHVYASRKRYKTVVGRTRNQCGSTVDRCVISSYEASKRLGFDGTVYDWTRVLTAGR